MFNALRYHARLQMRPESKSLVQYPVEAQLIDNVLEAQKVIFNLIFNRWAKTVAVLMSQRHYVQTRR